MFKAENKDIMRIILHEVSGGSNALIRKEKKH